TFGINQEHLKRQAQLLKGNRVTINPGNHQVLTSEVDFAHALAASGERLWTRLLEYRTCLCTNVYGGLLGGEGLPTLAVRGVLHEQRSIPIEPPLDQCLLSRIKVVPLGVNRAYPRIRRVVGVDPRKRRLRFLSSQARSTGQSRTDKNAAR